MKFSSPSAQFRAISLLVILAVFSNSAFAQNNVGIGTANPDASALLELSDATRGVLVPRMTSTQRQAIAAPANGLLVYDLTLDCFYYFVTATGWQSLCQSGGGSGGTGPTGPQGVAGVAGATGVAGDTGPAGTPGPQGSTGAQGNPGNTGNTGPAGPTGDTGQQGIPGNTGPSGVTGPTGDTGPNWTITNFAYNPNGTLNLTTTLPQNLNTTAGAWLTRGNAGTVAPADFIGTTDNIDWVIKTNNIERARVRSTGVTSVNNATPVAGNVFSSYSAGYTGTITAGAGTTAVAGYSAGSTGVGVLGANINGDGVGVQGTTNGKGGVGVYGANTANLTTANDAAYGVYGTSSGTNAANTFSFGVVGYGANAPSIGVSGAGNGQPNVVPTTGAGGAFTGTNIAAFAQGTTVASGTGFVGVGNNLPQYTILTSGSGISGAGASYGVAGFATAVKNTDGSVSTATGLGPNGASGGYFEVQNAGAVVGWSFVAVRDNANVVRKIIGSGTVNTIVKDLDDKLVALSCPEAPENLFQDFGKGQLVNGRAHITLDPVFSKNIVVNELHDLRVFVQLEGDCKGVYVTNKTAQGFDVVELNSGQANVPFSFMVSANRADEVLADGSIARYSAERFPVAPGPPAKTEGKVVVVPQVGRGK